MTPFISDECLREMSIRMGQQGMRFWMRVELLGPTIFRFNGH